MKGLPLEFGIELLWQTNRAMQIELQVEVIAPEASSQQTPRFMSKLWRFPHSLSRQQQPPPFSPTHFAPPPRSLSIHPLTHPQTAAAHSIQIPILVFLQCLRLALYL